MNTGDRWYFNILSLRVRGWIAATEVGRGDFEFLVAPEWAEELYVDGDVRMLSVEEQVDHRC